MSVTVSKSSSNLPKSHGDTSYASAMAYFSSIIIADEKVFELQLNIGMGEALFHGFKAGVQMRQPVLKSS